MMEQEWLPALQVWARRDMEQESPSGPVTHRATAKWLLTEETSLKARSRELESSPTCPICEYLCLLTVPRLVLVPVLTAWLGAGLCAIEAAARKALVIACLHCFCIDCLRRWVDRSRACPLCKVRPSSLSLARYVSSAFAGLVHRSCSICNGQLPRQLVGTASFGTAIPVAPLLLGWAF